MIIRKPYYYDLFSCSCGDCPNTCCRDWEIVVDPKHAEFYQTLGGVFGDALRSILAVDADGDTILSLSGKKCPLLTTEGLCSLQKRHGESSLCDVCRNFPRYRYEFGASSELGLSISCPEVCKLLLENDFSLTENLTNDPPSLNDIRADRYYTFFQGRRKAFQIALNRTFPAKARIAALLSFAERLERADSDPEPLLDVPFTPSGGFPASKRDFSRLQEVFLNMEFLREEDRLLFTCNRMFRPIPEEECERLLCYYIYKYFLQAAYDGKLLWRMEFAAASILMIFCACEDYSHSTLIDTAVRISRETEHSEDNLRYFSRSFTRKKLPLLLRLLS